MNIPIKRALLSVSNKINIVNFANELIALDVEIISTGGTSAILDQAKLPHSKIEAITGFPEIFEGRVKTLHPKIHGGILGRRDQHAKESERHQIPWIDLVVVNFYPFDTKVTYETQVEAAVEYIDIGGPTMVRAAAKNFQWVGAVVDPNDYAKIIAELKQSRALSFATRKQLAAKAFVMTSTYETAICNYFSQGKLQEDFTQNLNLPLQKHATLRYGENPHQKAYAYQFKQEKSGLFSAHQHQGKSLSYNNLLDAEAAWRSVSEFSAPACIIVKHANPCGAAQANNIGIAYRRAYAADSVSAFGGIVALNEVCDKELAETIIKVFTEVVVAPAYTEEALAVFTAKPNLRILELPIEHKHLWEMRFITGGVLMQEKDLQVINAHDLLVVTAKHPSPEDTESMLFAWCVVKHIKSNAILIAKDNVTLGIGAGQVSRIDAVNIAIQKAGDNIKDSVLASDAFFPFRDNIDRIAKTGVRAIIQPGGSVRDDEVIQACDEYGIAMVFTGKRCFRH